MAVFGGCLCHARVGRSAPTVGPLRRDRSGSFLADASSLTRSDPTGTYKIRRAFLIDFTARWNALRRLTRELLTERDELGLGRNPIVGTLSMTLGSPESKIDVFAKWFGNAIATVVVAKDGRWVEPFIYATYRKGAWDAVRHLGRPNAVPPMDPSRIGLMVRIAANEVDGLGDEVERQVIRLAANHIAAGGSPRDLMRIVSDRIDKIGIVRSATIVSVQVVSTHATASLDIYANAGVRMVGLKAEYVERRRVAKDAREQETGRFTKAVPRRDPGGRFSTARLSRTRRRRLAELQIVEITTAGDEDVCEDCAALEDNNPYTMDEATGLIPAHPNCRCAWTPAGEYEYDGFLVTDYQPYRWPARFAPEKRENANA